MHHRQCASSGPLDQEVRHTTFIELCYGVCMEGYPWFVTNDASFADQLADAVTVNKRSLHWRHFRAMVNGRRVPTCVTDYTVLNAFLSPPFSLVSLNARDPEA